MEYIRILVFEIGLSIGLILGACLYNLIEKVKNELYWKKQDKYMQKYLKYCEENNLCPPGVSFIDWKLEKQLEKESRVGE